MAYRFEYRASFWQDYSSALAYIAGNLKNPIATRELDEAFDRDDPSARHVRETQKPPDKTGYTNPVKSDGYPLRI